MRSNHSVPASVRSNVSNGFPATVSEPAPASSLQSVSLARGKEAIEMQRRDFKAKLEPCKEETNDMGELLFSRW